MYVIRYVFVLLTVFNDNPIKAQISDEEMRINCRLDSADHSLMGCQLIYNGKTLLHKEVRVNTESDQSSSQLAIYVGNRADQSFTDLGRVRMPVWRDQGSDDRPGVNGLAGKNVLSLVFVLDMAEFEQPFWALVSETYRMHNHKTGHNEERIDRMGRLEVTVFIVQNDELRDRWNAEDTFKLNPVNKQHYIPEVLAGLKRLDNFEKSPTNDNVLDWPTPHPMLDLFLDDFLILNTQHSYQASDTGPLIKDYNYLSIERALLLKQPD